MTNKESLIKLSEQLGELKFKVESLETRVTLLNKMREIMQSQVHNTWMCCLALFLGGVFLWFWK